MVKGLINHKVRQSAPRPPAEKCSPPRSEESGQRGRKPKLTEQVPLVAESIAGPHDLFQAHPSTANRFYQHSPVRASLPWAAKKERK